MADNETIADIIAEMRRCIAVKMSDAWYTQEEWRKLCDRLEAAYKREKAAIEADALEVGGIVEAAHKRERGDCAKLRDALALIATIEYPHNFQRERFDIADACQDLTNAIDTARAALSAPPRNCDRFATADEAFHAWNNTTDTPGGGAYAGLIDWLFAPATEKEGGAK